VPDEPAARYTWAQVLAGLGPPTAEDRALYAVHLPPAALAEAGSHIRSSHICTDVLRWSGQLLDYWQTLPEPARRQHHAFDMGAVRVLAAEAFELREMDQQHQAQRAEGAAFAQSDRSVSNSVLDHAEKTRDQLYAILVSAARPDADRQIPLLNAVFNQRSQPAAVAESLEKLCTRARAMLTPADGLVAQRLARRGITEASLAERERLAQQMRTLGERTGSALHRPDVSQADLDAKDGICLALMEDLMREVTAAHNLDPAVPNLVPIATRRYFRRARHAPPKALDVPTP
jgi:hypothetical protein